MSYPEFREEIFGILKGMVPANVRIELIDVEKLNSSMRHGISFQKEGECYAPTIYLEPFYNGYRNGKDIEALAREVLHCYAEETCELPESVFKLEHFESARENIYCKLIHIAENQRLLQETPHITYLDFAIVPYFEVNNDRVYRGSVLLKKEHVKSWEISGEELLNWAVRHTFEAKGVLFKPMSEILSAFISEGDGEIYDHAHSGMFVLTNQDKYLGAILIYYPEVLRMIAEKLGEDFYMLPASVHEWVIVPESFVVEESSMLSTVQHINDLEVLEEEVLSYNIYRYFTSSQKIHVFKSVKYKNY